MAIELDIGAVGVATGTKNSPWKPPRHVYFGPRDPVTNEMIEEPTYKHQEFPRLYYKREKDKIIGKLFHSAEEVTQAGDGWEKQPGELGYIGAPTLEQSIEMAREAEREKQEGLDAELMVKAEVLKRKPGRPVGS